MWERRVDHRGNGGMNTLVQRISVDKADMGDFRDLRRMLQPKV